MLDCLNHRRCLTSSTIFEFFLFIENKVFVTLCVEYKFIFACQLEVCGNIIFVIRNSHHIKGTLSLS